jgi:hypothetical protein
MKALLRILAYQYQVGLLESRPYQLPAQIKNSRPRGFKFLSALLVKQNLQLN